MELTHIAAPTPPGHDAHAQKPIPESGERWGGQPAIAILHMSYTGLMISRRILLVEPVFTTVDII